MNERAGTRCGALVLIEWCDFKLYSLFINSSIVSDPNINSFFLFFESKNISSLLAQVKYTPIISTTVFFNKEDVPQFKSGFGCLIPRSEGLTLLGVLFNSCIFPDRVQDKNVLSLTCMLRDEEGTIMASNEEQVLENIILPDLKKLLGINTSPLGYKMFKWQKGIPIYTPILQQLWQEIDIVLRKEHPHIRLLGNYTGQISVRGMAQHISKLLI